MSMTSTKMANKKAKDYAFVAIMLLIPVVHFIIFWGVVNFNSILLAFQRLDRTTGEKYLTLKNFESLVELFKTNELKNALVNTLLTAGFQIIFLLRSSFSGCAHITLVLTLCNCLFPVKRHRLPRQAPHIGFLPFRRVPCMPARLLRGP